MFEHNSSAVFASEVVISNPVINLDQLRWNFLYEQSLNACKIRFGAEAWGVVQDFSYLQFY